MLLLSTGFKNAMLGVSPALFNGGAIFVYTGTQPASSDAAPTGTLLGIVSEDGDTWALGSPINGLQIIPTTGGYLANDPGQQWKLKVTASGTAGWCRFVTYNDTLAVSHTLPRIDASVNEGSTGLQIANPVLVAGDVRPVDAWMYGIPPFN